VNERTNSIARENERKTGLVSIFSVTDGVTVVDDAALEEKNEWRVSFERGEKNG